MDTELKQYLDAMEARINAHFANVDAHFANVDAQFAHVDQRLAHVDQRFAHIDQRFAHIDQRVDEIQADFGQRIKESEERVVTLMTELKESLERQMNHRIDGLDARFEAQANRLDRQAALIQTGSRWSNRMTAWADKVDLSLDKKSAQIIDLHKRINKQESADLDKRIDEIGGGAQ
jgi:chromosome segregation ATPase